MDLERELRTLPVAWPETPAFALELRHRRRRWPIALAIALTALAAAFAVPQSRSAILDFLHIGGETIHFVQTLPNAEQRPLGVGLGQLVSPAVARQLVPRLLLPRLARTPPLHATGDIVSLVFEYEGRPVLLSEFGSEGGTLLKKLTAESTRIEPVRVDADYGLWLSGGPHVFFFANRSPRLAGDVLLWEHGRYGYRLEGPGLTKGSALALARSLE